MELVEGRATVEEVDTFVARLNDIGGEHGCTVQSFDARYIVSRRHLERALELADRARERGEAVARERAVEILLYAAGRRQIEQALELGVGEGEQPVVVLVAAEEGGEERGAVRAVGELLGTVDTLGAFDEERVRTFFDINDAELAATSRPLAALVCERVALLDVEK
jgi:KEOPS complex subunit Cgi121